MTNFKNNDHELIDVLSAISLVSGRLAKNLCILNPNPSEEIAEEITELLNMQKLAGTIASNLQKKAVQELIDSIKEDMRLKETAEELQTEVTNLFLEYFKECIRKTSTERSAFAN